VTNHPPETELALYSSGDLSSGDLVSVSRHLTDCIACRQRVSEFERLQTIFASLPAEPATDDLLAVRARVLEALNRHRKWQKVGKWALTAAAAAALVVLVRLQRPPVIHQRAIATAQQNAPQPIPAPHRRPQTLPVVHRRPHPVQPGLRSIALITAPGQSPMIRMTTSDPNVIILLPPDLQSDERTQSND
jgi:anti-sigma factor RsiW